MVHEPDAPSLLTTFGGGTATVGWNDVRRVAVQRNEKKRVTAREGNIWIVSDMSTDARDANIQIPKKLWPDFNPRL